LTLWVNVFVLFFISFADNAEQECENAIVKAIEADPNSLEAQQTLASLRISQCRPEEAAVILDRIVGNVKKQFEEYYSRKIADDLQQKEQEPETESGNNNSIGKTNGNDLFSPNRY
jgi:cytochrome c-type biogenesis protein CcmH/NrfG